MSAGTAAAPRPPVTTPARPGASHHTAIRITLAAFLAYALTGGGRIVGSDEVTMFELARAMVNGGIAVPEGATLRGPDGRPYTKNAAGEAVLAVPLVALGEAAARAAGLPAERHTLAARFVASFFNAGVAAILLGVFYAAARALAVRPAVALGVTAMLGFTTPLWVYSKSFMAEPLQGLGLLLALVGHALADHPRWRHAGPVGVLLAVSVKGSMLPFALLTMLPLLWQPRHRALPSLVAIGFAMAGHVAYNVARFGTWRETGYGTQATPAAYTTPLWVGLYGLLVSSGKGVVWFAPAIVLAPLGWAQALTARLRDDQQAWRRHRVALVGALAWIVALGLYGTFEHWAGDGSFGPRYLVPFLPPAFLGVAFALDRAGEGMKRLAWVLGVLGLLVQIGGVSIYYGAQMREARDYPYTLPLKDPRFMSDSHFNPAFSPIVGHWSMLVRNLEEHLAHQGPRLGGQGAVDPRLGVGAEDQRRLLHALDYWWLYAGYLGTPAGPLILAVTLLALAVAVAMAGAIAAAKAEDPEGVRRDAGRA